MLFILVLFGIMFDHVDQLEMFFSLVRTSYVGFRLVVKNHLFIVESIPF